MPNARLGKQLVVQTPNEVGTLAKVSQVFATKGINILSLCAYEQQNKGQFCIITENNSQGADELKKMGYTVAEKDVVLVEIENRPGTLAPVAKLLGDSHINVQNCFFTTGHGNTVTCVFTTADNQKAMQMIQQGSVRRAA